MTKNVEYLVTNARYNCHALDMCVPFSVSQTTFTVVRAEHVMVCRSIGTVWEALPREVCRSIRIVWEALPPAFDVRSSNENSIDIIRVVYNKNQNHNHCVALCNSHTTISANLLRLTTARSCKLKNLQFFAGTKVGRGYYFKNIDNRAVLQSIPQQKGYK